MVKGIIFDFDGVIVETESKKFKDLKKILRKYDYKLKKDSFFDLIGKKTGAFLAEKFPKMPDKMIEDIIRQRKELCHSNLKEYSLVPGIRQLLIFLKSKKQIIAITTGSERKFVEKILKIRSFSNYFDIIVSGEEFGSSKPNSECYRVTLEKLQLPPQEVIVIEDSVVGIKAAKAIGCTVFAIKTYLKGKLLSEADKIFKDHLGILNYLKK